MLDSIYSYLVVCMMSFCFWRFQICTLIFSFPCLSEQLNGVNLQGFTSQEVLDVMRQTGQTVNLTLVRKIALPKKSAVEISLDKGEHHAPYLL